MTSAVGRPGVLMHASASRARLRLSRYGFIGARPATHFPEEPPCHVQANRTLFVGRIITTLRRHVHYLIVALTLLSASMYAGHSTRANDAGDVHPLFDLSAVAGSPFPSDRFTVSDPEQITGRRVALPFPADCVANRSDCDDVTVLNELDGFNQHPRVSIPFDGDIDLSTATSENIFFVEVPERADEPPVGASCDSDAAEVDGEPSIGRLVGINQIVWDPEAHTLHARADEALEEHARYVLVVSRGVRDTNGTPIAASRNFETYRRDLCQLGDPESVWYRRQLIRAEWAARRAGVQTRDIAAVSLFHTQSSTYLMHRLHDAVFAAPEPARADFALGPAGERTVFALANVTAVTFNRQVSTAPTFSPEAGQLTLLRFDPGAVGTIAFGRYTAPDFRTHPGESIAPFATGTGAPAPTGTQTVYFNVYLPAGTPPPGGWPVAIHGTGSGGHKNLQMGGTTSQFAARGVALIAINIAGHGYGPLSTLTVARTDGPALTFPAGGRATDQSGDGAIGLDEGFLATGARGSRDLYDGYAQTAADLMQLVRVIQAGVDVDGDGAPDLDASRISYWGWSIGSNYGIGFVAATPEVTAAAFESIGGPALEHRRLSPVARGVRSAAGSPRGRRRCSTARPA